MKHMKWEEAKKVINEGLTFLEFKTTWCGDCKMMDPIINDLEKEIELKGIKEIKFISVDGEEANLFNSGDQDWQVAKVPSFYIIKNGIKTHIGYEYLPLELLIQSIINNL